MENPIKLCLLLLILLAGCSQAQYMEANKHEKDDRGEYHIIRVLTYNIIHGQSTSGEIDMDLFAEIIKEQDPDLVALQEVDKNTRRTGNLDVTAELSRRTGLEGFFGKYRDFGGGEYGDAILSKLPVLEFEVKPAYFTPEGKKRSYSFAKVKIAESTYIYFNTSHLTPYVQEEKVIQAEELVSYYEDTLNRAPLIIAGDLNAEPDSEAMDVFFEQFAPSDTALGNTFSTRSSLRKKIDYVLYPDNSNWKVFKTEVICRPDASDHCGLLAVLGFKKTE